MSSLWLPDCKDAILYGVRYERCGSAVFFKLESAARNHSGSPPPCLPHHLAHNLALAQHHQGFLNTRVQVRIAALGHCNKPLLLWINDGFMAIFFLLVGLEVKMLEGAASRVSRTFPGHCRRGGMLAPALYSFFNYGDEATRAGWRFRPQTDIAFCSPGSMALLGERYRPASKSSCWRWLS